MVFNVQVLRAVAATMVVWVHTQEIIVSDVLPHWTRNFGYGGVDLFFVISGFIMVCTTQNKDIHPLAFFRKRMLRVAPVYYFFTLLIVAVGLLMPAALNSTQPEFMQTMKSLLFVPFEKTPERVYPTYYLGWTLNYEMFFYSLFAVSLFLPKRLRLPAITSVIVSLTIAGSYIDNPSDCGVAAFFYTRSILLDFVLGVLVAGFSQKWARLSNPLPWWICLAAGGAWLVLGGQVLSFGSSVSPATDTFLRFGIPAALIVAASVRLEQSGIKIGTALMRHLGDASYSLYLSHYFFIGAVIAIAGLMELDDLGRALLTPVTIATAVAVGFATFYLLERPLAGDFSTYQSIGRLLFQARLRLLQRGIAKNAAIVGETQPVRHPDAFAKANK
jgi:exopolysaccharide production protein ExoZ